MPAKQLMTRDTMTGPIGTATKDGKGYTIKSTKDKLGSLLISRIASSIPMVTFRFIEKFLSMML